MSSDSAIHHGNCTCFLGQEGVQGELVRHNFRFFVFWFWLAPRDATVVFMVF